MSGEIAVESLPSKIVQVCSSHISAGPNNGDFVELTALCEDGSLWALYRTRRSKSRPVAKVDREFQKQTGKDVWEE